MKYLFTAVLLHLAVIQAISQDGFEHRGYLGWMIDLRRTACSDEWPSIRIDSALMSDYEETLGFMQQSGMNEITLWGLFTNKYWEPEIEKTISPERYDLVKRIIEKAHSRNIKIINGMGVHSWGFDKIIQQYPELGCACNNHLLDISNPGWWTWQKKIIDYLIDNFDFDGISMQSADLGKCKCGFPGYYNDMEYHAVINQKAISYIRSRKPHYIIGISGWGMDFGNPDELQYVKLMTGGADYVIDVGETVLKAGREYREKLIKEIAPCRYGNTATPNIEPIQAMPRDFYFIPTLYHASAILKEIYADGGSACETYARTRGNPGDRVTVEVIARVLSDPVTDIMDALKEILQEIYEPSDADALAELVNIYREAEDIFFAHYPGSDRELIEVMPRSHTQPESWYFERMKPSSQKKYRHRMNDLYRHATKLSGKVKNKVEMDLLIRCFTNVLQEMNIKR